MTTIPNGIAFRDARALAHRLGVAVEQVHRTGEVRFRACGLTVTHNMRRKDTSRALVALLRRAAQEARNA